MISVLTYTILHTTVISFFYTDIPVLKNCLKRHWSWNPVLVEICLISGPHKNLYNNKYY